MKTLRILIFLFFYFHIYNTKKLTNVEKSNKDVWTFLFPNEWKNKTCKAKNSFNNKNSLFNEYENNKNNLKLKGENNYINYCIDKTSDVIKNILTGKVFYHVYKYTINNFIKMFHNDSKNLTQKTKEILYIYFKSKHNKTYFFLKTFLTRFIGIYIIQIIFSFYTFHYFNILSQKIQSDYSLHISRSKVFSRIIGFCELNIVNYYFIVLNETLQIFFIRLFFNKYETCIVKTIIYNSEDYLLNKNFSNKYILIYQMVKKYVKSRINKLNIFSINYVKYLITTNFFFRITKGTYNKYCPSDVKMPGVYADIKKSIVKDMNYATKKEIACLKEFCKQTGCHTCGKTCYEKFICDHQPPVQVIKDLIEYYNNRKMLRFFMKILNLYDTNQRLYPQCLTCSSLQSAAVRCKKVRLIPHARTIRLFHFASIFHLLLKMIVYTKWEKLISWDNNNIY